MAIGIFMPFVAAEGPPVEVMYHGTSWRKGGNASYTDTVNIGPASADRVVLVFAHSQQTANPHTSTQPAFSNLTINGTSATALPTAYQQFGNISLSALTAGYLTVPTGDTATIVWHRQMTTYSLRLTVLSLRKVAPHPQLVLAGDGFDGSGGSSFKSLTLPRQASSGAVDIFCYAWRGDTGTRTFSIPDTTLMNGDNTGSGVASLMTVAAVNSKDSPGVADATLSWTSSSNYPAAYRITWR